jgi:Fe-S cluster assembly iron-binding protein IscA
MLEVSERARAELKKVLDTAACEPDHSLRLAITGPDQLGLGVDVERPGDEVYEYEGDTVLMVDQNIAELVKDRRLDVSETEEGRKLTIGNAVGENTDEQAA